MNDMFKAPAMRKDLRPHQTTGLGMLRQSMKAGHKRIVMQGPTGFGKTLVGARIIEGALSKGNAVIFTAPAISLIDQTVEAFEAEGITGIGVMQAQHPRTDPLAQVQVASVQTLARRMIPDAALVIWDECHINADVMVKLMQDRPDVYFVGLSATPWAKGMGLIWEDLVIPVTIGQLIDQGYLSKFTVYAPDVPDLSGVKSMAGDYAEDALAEVMGDAKLVGNIVQTWLANGQNRPTLMFGVNRAHAKAVAEEFERAGVAAGYCDAMTDSVERKVLERRFRSGEVKVACSVRTLTTGVDWPVSCIIDAAPTRSEMLHVQKIGRGLRVNPGTEDLIILDHAGNSLRLGLVTDIHHSELDKTPKGEKQKTKPQAEKLPKACANCGALHTGLICPYCGHERKPIAGVETADGELIQISGKTATPTKQMKQEWWSALKAIQKAKRRSDKWCSYTFRAKFGTYPRGLHDMPGTASPEVWNYVKSRDIAYAKRKEIK